MADRDVLVEKAAEAIYNRMPFTDGLGNDVPWSDLDHGVRVEYRKDAFIVAELVLASVEESREEHE